MSDDPGPQIAADIAAFVNGQLDGERRFAVADYLARHPQRAAEVMAELRLTEGLRLALGTVETPAPPRLRRAARRFPACGRRWLPVAAALAFAALGWGARSVLTDDPAPRALDAAIAAVLDYALDAEEAVALQTLLGGGTGPMPRAPQEVARRLGIDLPDLPQGWAIRAAQVVATPERPGVAVILDTPELGEILLFGLLRSIDGPDRPATVTRRDGRALAFFERDRTAYVLVDSAGSPADLRRSAEALRLRFP